MKSIKLLFYSLFISTILLTSCTNDDVSEVPDMQESVSTQLALNQLSNLYADDGTAIESMNPTGHLIFDFCFEFVYPINLMYNNGSIITITSNEELIEVLINMTDQLHIAGIEFPFNVEIYNPETNEIELLTITNETEFTNLLASCFFDNFCECDDEFDPVCIEIIEANQPITVTFPNACYAECEGFTEEDFVDCGETSCEDECSQEEDPVCVEIVNPNGITEIITFLNACYAACEGFTVEDFLDCNSTDCDISELEIELGETHTNETYQLTINFEYENTNGQEYFDLYVRNGVLLGYFQLSELPLTIEHFPLSGRDYDYIKVCINDNSDCCEAIEWEVPSCSADDCTEDIIASYLVECPWDINASSGDYVYIFNSDLSFSITLSDNSYSTSGTYSLSTNASGEIVVTMLEEFNDFNHEWTFSNCDFANLQVTSSDPNTNTIEINCSDNDDCYQYVFPIQMTLAGNVVEVGSNEHIDYKLDLGYELIYPIELIINSEIILVYQGILEGVYGERCD
jgi:hypothetical protein